MPIGLPRMLLQVPKGADIVQRDEKGIRRVVGASPGVPTHELERATLLQPGPPFIFAHCEQCGRVFAGEGEPNAARIAVPSSSTTSSEVAPRRGGSSGSRLRLPDRKSVV